MLWIPITVAAAGSPVARNAAPRDARGKIRCGEYAAQLRFQPARADSAHCRQRGRVEQFERVEYTAVG